MQTEKTFQPNQKYGRLTLTGRTFFLKKYGQSRRMVEAKCDCGVIKEYVFDSIRKGDTQSCGCLKTEELKETPHAKTHGLTNHPLFTIWRGMRERCYYPSHNRYYRYGALGIKICPQWRDDFKAFFDWAITHGWQEGYSIERRYNDKDYEPANCTFIMKARQNSNTSETVWLTAFGETKNVTDWANDSRCKVTMGGLRNRIGRDKANWPNIEEAITTPPETRGETIKYKLENRMIFAFGEEKSMADWLKDERCVVDERSLRKRLNKQWDGEKALSTHLRKSRQTVISPARS